MSPKEEKKEIDAEEITVTGSASHGFGKEDFEEELSWDEDEEGLAQEGETLEEK